MTGKDGYMFSQAIYTKHSYAVAEILNGIYLAYL